MTSSGIDDFERIEHVVVCGWVVSWVIFIIQPYVSISSRMTSPRSWTNFLVNTFALLFSISGQLSFIVCAISEMAMLGRESHSQLKSFNRLNRLTSAVPYLQENRQACVNKCGVSVCACLTGWSVGLLSWSDVQRSWQVSIT